MTATNEDLRNAVAEELQLISAGVPLSSEDATLIDGRIPRILSWLDESESLVYWPDDEIPDGAMEPLTMIVAERVAPAFTLAYDKGSAGLVLLRRLAAAKVANEPTKAKFY